MAHMLLRRSRLEQFTRIFRQRFNVKILIGITQEPAKAKKHIHQQYGKNGSLTEVGPFLTMVDALNWLVYLKSLIWDFEEIIPERQAGKDVLWYGFTFEKTKEH